MQVDLRDMSNMVSWSNIYLVGFPLGDNGKNTGEAILKKITAEDFPKLLKGNNPKIQF